MVGDGTSRDILSPQLHDQNPTHHHICLESPLFGQDSDSMYEPCDDELWPPALAGHSDASPGSPKPTSDFNQSAQPTHRPDKSHPLLIPPCVAGRTNPQPTIFTWTLSWPVGSAPLTTLKCPRARRSIQHETRIIDRKIGSSKTKENTPTTGGVDRVQRARRKMLIALLSKVFYPRTRLRRLRCKSLFGHGLEPHPTDATGQEPHEEEHGKSFLKREGQVPEKEVTTTPQDVNKLHNLECLGGEREIYEA